MNKTNIWRINIELFGAQDTQMWDRNVHKQGEQIKYCNATNPSHIYQALLWITTGAWMAIYQMEELTPLTRLVKKLALMSGKKVVFQNKQISLYFAIQ